MSLAWQTKGSDYDRNSHGTYFLFPCSETGDRSSDQSFQCLQVWKGAAQTVSSVSDDFWCTTRISREVGSIAASENRRYRPTALHGDGGVGGWKFVTPRLSIQSYETLFFGQRQRQAGLFTSRCSGLFPLLCTGPVRSLHPSLLPDDAQQQQQSQAEQRQHGGHRHWHCRWD